MSRRTALVGMAIVVAAGIGLRCFRLSERSVWFDEASAVTMITRFGWAEMIERCAQNVHPPLYYFVLRGWAGVFGDSVLALRCLSVVLAAVTLAGIYLCARDAYRLGREDDESVVRIARGIGLTAAALLAVSSSQIVWAQQIRMYMLGTALAAFSSWTLVRALLGADSVKWWWAAYSLLAAGLMYTHNYGLFTVFAHGLFVIGYVWRQSTADQPLLSVPAVRFGLAAFAVTLLLYSPWIPTVVGQTQQVHNDYWIGPLRLWTLPNAWTDLLLPRNETRPPEKPLACVVSVLLIAALVALVWKGCRGDWFVLLCTVVPVACAVVLSLTLAPMLISRYLLFAHLFLLVALAGAIWRWVPQPLTTAAIVLLLADSLFAHWSYWNELKIPERPGLKALAEQVRARRTNGEPVIVAHPLLFHAARVYLADTVEPKLFVGEQTLPHYLAQPLLTDADRISTAELRALAADRLWVLDTTGFRVGYRHAPLPEPWRAAEGSTVAFPEVFCFQGEVTATLYDRQGSNKEGGTETDGRDAQ